MDDLKTKQRELLEEFNLVDKHKVWELIQSVGINDVNLLLYRAQKLHEWDRWKREIPYLNFDPKWLVKAIPPFPSAMIRYWLKHKEIEGSHVSIYLECYDFISCHTHPFWEIYPVEDDAERFDMNDTEGLLDAVRRSFADQEKKAIG